MMTQQEAITARHSVRKYIDKEIPANITQMDLGIAKYHFEIGAGKDNLIWA